MATRTTQSIAHFDSAFILAGLDAPQPAGEYRIVQDEELIEGVSWLAWRRVSTVMHLPAIGTGKPARQMLQIHPAELEAALEKDHKQK